MHIVFFYCCIPAYELFAYAEGEKMSGMFQKKTLPKGGIPVLFIPGNSGSAKQVRSLASVALRKALEMDKKYRTRFDFFAVDFDEELSALSGSVLKDQHEFVIKSIGHILGMYKKGAAGSPRSVVLIGHSIGGVVAKSVFLRYDWLTISFAIFSLHSVKNSIKYKIVHLLETLLMLTLVVFFQC